MRSSKAEGHVHASFASGAPGLCSTRSSITHQCKVVAGVHRLQRSQKMLTPAEELGLAGHSVAARVRRALHQLDEGLTKELLSALTTAAWERRCVYERDGKYEAVRILPTPMTLLSDQLHSLHSVSLALLRATRRLLPMSLADEAVHDVVRLSEEEDAWLRELWTPAVAATNPVFGRLDAVVDVTSAHWKQTLQFIEPNLNGVGGLHLLPAAEAAVQELVFPILQRVDSRLALDLSADVRALLMQTLIEHLEAIGEPGRTLCFLEPKYSDSGPDDQGALATYCHEHFGITALHADPAELELRGGVVTFDGQPIHCAYRDYSLADVLALRASGVDVRPMRRLFETNRMVSSVAGDLDVKAVWEVLTDDAYAAHFSNEERALFHRHVPWTRRVFERRTTLADGRDGELLPFVRDGREGLVLKPNRAFGGTGVVVGPGVTSAEWDAALALAVSQPREWVVQRLAPLPLIECPVLGADGHVQDQSFFLVLGLTPTDDGLSVLARASQKLVVNVAKRGGVVVAAVAHGPGRAMR